MKNNKSELEIEKRMFYKLGSNENSKRSFRYLTIPPYQRRYDWKKDEIDSFFEEIKNKAKEISDKFSKFKKRYGNLQNILKPYAVDSGFLNPIYFGNIVINISSENKPNEVVDGQQRLTTFALCLKALKLLEVQIKKSQLYQENTEAFNPLFAKLSRILIQQDDHGEEHYFISSKNEKDSKFLDDVFKMKSLNEGDGIKKNNKFLSNFKDIKLRLDGESDELKLFILYSILTTEFGVISFSGDDRAYELFEALNSKGLQLSPSDLIKNHLFRLEDESSKGTVEDKWSDLTSYVDSEKSESAKNISSFIRYYFVQREKEYIKKKDLFSYFRRKITRENYLEFLDKIIDTFSIYFDINNKNSRIFKNLNDSEKIFLELFLKGIPKIYLPIIFYLLEKKIDNNDLYKSFEWLFKQGYIHFTINNLPSKELDKKVPKVIKEIDNIENLNFEEIKNTFSNYLLSETFKDGLDYSSRIKTLETKDFDNRNNLLHLYTLIYEHEQNNKNQEFSIILNKNNIQLEHLMPKVFQKWLIEDKNLTKKEAEENIFLIGNTLFIKGKINSQIKNNIWKEKLSGSYIEDASGNKAFYGLKNSNLFKSEMEKSFDKIPEKWNVELIRERTKKIVNLIISKNILNPDEIK